MMENHKKYFFISDIHLGLQSKESEQEKEKLLVNFLNYVLENNGELFILGDLFDYWFEYKRVYQKGFFRTLTALHNLTQAGLKVHYFIGNHDFMHHNFFTEELGIKVYENAEHFELGDKKFFLGHGDGLVENDLGYNILKKILRNKFFQWLYSFIHPDLGIGIASRTSKQSRDYTTKKDYGKPDGLLKAAKELIDKGYDFVIFGHLHLRTFEQYKTGTYINLGSWLQTPCYAVFQNNVIEVVEWKENGKEKSN